MYVPNHVPLSINSVVKLKCSVQDHKQLRWWKKSVFEQRPLKKHLWNQMLETPINSTIRSHDLYWHFLFLLFILFLFFLLNTIPFYLYYIFHHNDINVNSYDLDIVNVYKNMNMLFLNSNKTKGRKDAHCNLYTSELINKKTVDD